MKARLDTLLAYAGRAAHLVWHSWRWVVPEMVIEGTPLYSPHRALTMRARGAVFIACDCGRVWRRLNVLEGHTDDEVLRWLLRQPKGKTP